MSLQTGLPTRRQFLERSAWGFGSAFVLPSLLANCTDHNIPPSGPDTPITIPPLGDDSGVAWNDVAKSAIITKLRQKPKAGDILSALATILWPSSGEDVWDQLRNQAQTLVGKSMSDSVYSRVKDNLNFLKTWVHGYLTTLTNGTPEQINGEWVRVTTAFNNSQIYFKLPGYELLLLPFYAQFANLYLALLRDGVAFGQSWGRSDADQQQTIKDLTAYIQVAAQDQVTSWYNAGRDSVRSAHQGNWSEYNVYYCEPFRSINEYDRGMTLLVLDFRPIWPYFDVTQYPNGANVVLTREIYSDPYGGCSSLVLPPSPPTQFPTQLSVWGGNLIDAVQLTYPAYGGPGGVTKTDRLGDPNGGTNQSPAGGTFDLSTANPITKFQVVNAIDPANLQGPYVTAMQFQYYDGTTTDLLGGKKLPSDYKTKKHVDGTPYYEVTGWLGYGYEALSSIFVGGLSDRYNTASGIVLGFKHWQPPK